MIKLIILLIIIAIGAGYYLGYFTADDSPKDMIEKVESMAKDRVENLKDSAKDTVKESLEKARDAVK